MLFYANLRSIPAEGANKMRTGDIRNTSFIAELGDPRVAADVAVDLQRHLDLATVHFIARADVARALGNTSSSGWPMTFPAEHLASSEHVVAPPVRPLEITETGPPGERTSTPVARSEFGRSDEELANAARRAAKVLADRQQAPGYWLTQYTDGTRFERPSHEMNTFVNAMMIDVAGPVAEAAGLAGVLARAHDFLASQIEAGGLVRYHGRADAPTIGRLGCVITPDADDTALVWRIAPGKPPELLSEALATLSQFRRTDGLYRTWLASPDRYKCIDPGKDPNPADIGIQIHVLMLLTQADPPAAAALCQALRQRAADEDIWVYYKIAPLVPLLRLADVRMAGCPLQLPLSRLETTVAGQEVWVQLIQLLHRMESERDAHGAYSETVERLRKLAANDFSLLSSAPPLLYHNDFTATVRRFYWSEELGYALWLRVFFENERARSR